MKILELRLKNLNSLEGEWLIDFTDPAYASMGLFALVGATGAGKSTLLDAICLALFCRTPRLKVFSQSENEIMSRRTGECFAEVLVETQAQRLRCRWSQHRARKNPRGRLQEPFHEISDGLSGKPLATQRSKTVRVVEEKIGMNFERFTRSIMLAQGRFDSFLRAEARLKSQVLEQITGTVIYSAISQQVHERHRQERARLDVLQVEAGGIEVLSGAERTEVQSELGDLLRDTTMREQEMAKLTQGLEWQRRVQQLQQEINSVRTELEAARRAREGFAPEHERLKTAQRASGLEGFFVQLTITRNEQTQETAQKAELFQRSRELELQLQERDRDFDAAQKQHRAVQAHAQELLQTVGRARALDERISELETSLRTAKDVKKLKADQLAERDRAISLAQSRLTQVQTQFGRVSAYLEKNAADAWLVGGLAGVNEQLRSLEALREELKHGRKASHEALQGFSEAQRQQAQLREQVERARRTCARTLAEEEKNRSALRELLQGRELREHREKKEQLERELSLLLRIAELEDQRKRLRDGEPCPLCGAREHPYAQGNIPALHETEREIAVLSLRLTQAEEIAEKGRVLADLLAQQRMDLAAAESGYAAASAALRVSEGICVEKEALQAKLEVRTTQFEAELQQKLAPLGILGLAAQSTQSLLRGLQERESLWQKAQRECAGYERDLAEKSAELERLNALRQETLRVLDEHEVVVQDISGSLSVVQTQRQEFFGGASVASAEDALQREVMASEESLKAAQINRDQMQKECNQVQGQLISLVQRISQRKSILEQHEKDFSARLRDLGFAHETDYQNARLTAEECESIEQRGKCLEDAVSHLCAKMQDREQSLAREQEKDLTSKSSQDLESDLRELSVLQDMQRNRIAALRFQLQEDDKSQGRVAEVQAKVATQKLEVQRWGRLHSLIGSADGQKYRNFAQGLTFERMVALANQHLQKMTDRYVLIHNPQEPLELQVIDSYQAGEVRTIRNLSGGESFLVSLSLALGLSKMSSQNIRVDSLFLDEGFGTLDEDTLETALAALASLQHDNKLIGVISHVSAIKECVSTQIKVESVSGGRSVLRGPGCRQLHEERLGGGRVN